MLGEISAEQMLIIAHVIGTIIGVGGATMVEVHLNRAQKNGVSEDERALLGADYSMMRIGLVILIISGFGFLLLDKFEGNTKYLYSPRLWAKLLLVVIIAGNTLLLQSRLIGLYWGTALSFVSWWMAALIGMFVTHGVRFDFFGEGGFWTTIASLTAIYVVALILGAVILDAIRKKINPPTTV